MKTRESSLFQSIQSQFKKGKIDSKDFYSKNEPLSQFFLRNCEREEASGSKMDKRNHILIIHLETFFKMYKVSREGIKYLKEAQIKPPIDVDSDLETKITNHHIHFFVKKGHVVKNESSLKFFKKHKIDWYVGATLVFRCCYTLDRFPLSDPCYLGEIKHQLGSFVNWGSFNPVHLSKNSPGTQKGLVYVKRKLFERS